MSRTLIQKWNQRDDPTAGSPWLLRWSAGDLARGMFP